MITGSHNPPDYNGDQDAQWHGHSAPAFFGDDILRLGQTARGGLISPPGRDGIVEDWPMTGMPYVDVARLRQDFNVGPPPLSVAWDAGNGAAGEIRVARNCRRPTSRTPTFALNAEIDGTFPNAPSRPDGRGQCLAQLRELVAGRGCDLGIGFDGDGDRIGVIDAAGRVVWGDQTDGIILAREILARRPGATDHRRRQGQPGILFDEIAKAGGKPIMWMTGHSLIKNKMAEERAPLAGEMSGHIFFADGYYGFDDAIYAAIRLLSIIAQVDHGLGAMIDALPQMQNTPELRFDCAENRKFVVIDEVKARLAADPEAEVHTLDGVRVSTADGWWLLRASNTQAVLVARCEASTEDGLSRLKQALNEQLAASGIQPPEFYPPGAVATSTLVRI